MSESHSHHVARLENALNSIESGAVYTLAAELRDSGLSQVKLLAVFDEVLVRHQGDSDERKYDAILEVMDRIAGWYSPGESLYS